MFLLRGFAYASTQTIYEFGAMNERFNISKPDLALYRRFLFISNWSIL